MKTIKIFVISILIVACAFTVTACDFDFASLINKIITENVFPYSEDGFREISINYPIENGDVLENIDTDIDLDSIISDVDSIAYSFDITVTKDGVENNFKIKYFRDSSGEVYYDKFVYQKGSTEQVILRIGEQRYYIDENSKTYYPVSTDTVTPILFSPMQFACLYAGKYGVIDLFDEEDQPNWTFVSKDDSASIINYEEESQAVIGFSYNSIEQPSSNKSVAMNVYFAKMLIPYIARIDYTIVETEEPDTTITVFRIFETEEITEELFAVPTSASGYTLGD
ncbi:MAG: hypothetical protein EOM87_00610 [Clostridia bacterium]|nr:hypothetical protein [Clostridia bacterium]